jgi:malate/lactate dehydrogenase
VKVVIAGGAGGVGASIAFNLLLGPGEYDVLLLDRRPEMVTSHAMDLEQVLEQGAIGSIREGSDTDLPGADIVVVAASAPLTVNDSRMVYLEANARIVAGVADRLPPGWDGVLLVVTNPVDPLCTWIQQRTGLDRRRVVGYTLNDSLRLRTGIGRALGLAPGRVEAWMIGEHGSLAVPLFDRVTVDGTPVQLGHDQLAQVHEFIGNWYVRHVALDSGRSSTWTSGLGVARMVSAIANGAPDQSWPASVMLAGEYGIDGVSVSVPVSFRPGAVDQILEWELMADQRQGLHEAADFVREATEGLGGLSSSDPD